MMDRAYYEHLMTLRAEALRVELTAGKSIEEQMAMDEELEERVFMPHLLAVVARNLPQARAMVNALKKMKPNGTPVDLMWVKNYPGYEYGQLAMSRMSFAEMLDYLREISTLDFGDDIAQWEAWLEAFEADPPLLGYR